MKELYRSYSNIQLLEAIYDAEVLNTLRAHCQVYIHGHSAGGTNPSLVEAMHLRLPIAAFDVVYNRATTEGHAKFFKDATALARLLLETPMAEWEAQRKDMKEIADRRYRWATIADRYAESIAAG
jgi:glycosyltransferase involved in cell wall biosynthesis